VSLELKEKRALVGRFYKLRRGAVKSAKRYVALLEIVVQVHEVDPRMSDEEIESSIESSLQALSVG